MYESESNPQESSQVEVPLEILERFAETRSMVSEKSLIPWGEHCTECVWPTCYTTCTFYQPRVDGRCRRFVDGMVRVPCQDSLNGYLLKITFRPWAKLWSPANARLYSLTEADEAERRDRQLAGLIQLAPISRLKSIAMHKRYSFKKRAAQRPAPDGPIPDFLLIECFNPGPVSVAMTLVVRSAQRSRPFQELIVMEPGFQRHPVPTSEIMKCVNFGIPFDIELTPNLIDTAHTLFFGAMDFVIGRGFAPDRAQPRRTEMVSTPDKHICKCIAWDLDNTIWDGTLVEDGVDGLLLRPQIRDVLKTLDERGILLSVISKNNEKDALAALQHFAIADYFLFPQISWNPKSTGIRALVSQLNIGMDSLLFVDDSAFEREEVRRNCPGVTVIDASDYGSILLRTDCQVPITAESRKRRFLYREQHVRDEARDHFEGDYIAFLRDCRLRLTIRTLDETNVGRVHELTQRTNQMNFSGNRYSFAQLKAILADPCVDTYVLDCDDRFGSYGTIGFCTVQSQLNCVTDLMFSCRVQAKRVEHAFLAFLLSRRQARTKRDLRVAYRKTSRNETSGAVFNDLGFLTEGEEDGVLHLMFPAGQPVPDDRIVEIVDLTQANVELFTGRASGDFS